MAGDSGRLVSPQTPLMIASLSKSFTALGIMQLVDEGKLRLDAPVQEYLPWFTTRDSNVTEEITIRRLLYHA